MRVFRIFCLIYTLLFLVSCAPAGDSSQIAGLAGTTALPVNGDTTLRYTAVYGATPDWLNVSSSAAAGNGRFWQTAVRYENEKNTLFIASIAAEGGYFERHPYVFKENAVANAIASIPGEPGALWFVEQRWNSELHIYEESVLRRVNAQGGSVVEADLRDVPFDGTGTYGAVDGDGNYYLYTAGKIFSFSVDAKLRFSLDCAGFSGFARASDGTMLLLASDTKGTKLARIDGAGDLETLLSCTFFGIADGDGEYDIYAYDRVLYGIRLDTGDMTPLCRFAELDIIANDVIAVQTTGVCEDGSPKFACYASSGSKILLCTIEKTARAAKKTLTLGVLSVDNGVEQAVVDYNRASTEFRVELIEYATADDPTGVTGLNLALTSGQTPDLLDLYGVSVDVYARKGVLADLSAWMDDTVNRDKILPVLLPLLENDSAIYALPRGFSVRTLFSTDALIGDRDSWGFTDMLSLLDRNPAVTQPLARMTAETGLRILQDAATGGCIDAVAGVYDFTQESFIGYLELLRCFPDTIPGEEDTDTLLREGRTLCRYTPSMTVGQFMDLCGAYSDSLRTPGLPEVGNTVDFGHALSITAACSDSAAAWDFIKSYVTGTSYSPYGMWSIPILSDAYAAYIDETVAYYARAQANNTYVNGAPIHVPDDADWAAWDTFLSSVTKASSIDNAVGAIVAEEVSAYLGGARTAEETAHVIDSRVKILLAESA